MSSLVGITLGQYQLVEQIGRGGMATVYRAHQPALGRDVAVKVLRDLIDPAAAARFEREARAVASLHHPNILPLYDYGEDGGQRYFVTQYILGGRTLADETAAGPLAPARALALMALVLDALAYAHGRGIVHRDVKPANVMLPSPDWPLLADFGIAESLSATTQLTLPGQIIGTANYMAPERAADRPSDARSDLYSVGVVLFELLTGRLPFAGDSPLAVLVQHVNEPPPAPSAFAPGLPVAVERCVLRALAKDPTARQQSAGEFAAELRRLARELEEAGLRRTLPPGAGSTTVALTTAQPAPVPRPAPLAPPRPAAQPLPSAPAPQEATPPRAATPAAAPRRSRLPLLLAGLGLIAALGFWLWTSGRPGGGVELTIEDRVWEGGFRLANGYAGRSATWIYAAGSDYDTMRMRFTLSGRTSGPAELQVIGMDSEGPRKTEILIAVNGQTIYNGENPLPDDDFNLENVDTGTWGEHRFPFDGAILRAGVNEIVIVNRSQGRPGQPPFFMLDYAVLRVGR